MSTHNKTLVFVIGFCLGIVIGEVSLFSTEVVMFLLFLGAIQAIIFFFSKRGDVVTQYPFVTIITLLMCCGMILGIIRVQLISDRSVFICETKCTFNAVIVSSPDIKDTYQTFVVHPLESDTGVYDILIRTTLYPIHMIGETISLTGKVSVPSIIMPHEDKKVFDYVTYLRTRNVGSELFFPSITITDSNAHTIRDHLGRWKENLITRIHKYVRTPEASLAQGMLFGGSSLSKEITDTFRVAGLSHIIVLSGFNIAIVISFILFVFIFLPLFVRITLASLAVILFVMMVGGEASIIRATLMAFVTLLATLLGRQYVAKQALILSLLCIILYEPQALLYDVSLHLSFLATTGLVYLNKAISEILKNKLSKNIRELFVTTLSAYLATLPYIMYTFGTVSVYALLANIIVLPFIPIAMLISFLVVVGSYASSSIGFLFGLIDTYIIAYVFFITNIINHLPFSTVTISISFLQMCILYVCLCFAIVYLWSRKYNETERTITSPVLTDIIPY